MKSVLKLCSFSGLFFMSSKQGSVKKCILGGRRAIKLKEIIFHNNNLENFHLVFCQFWSAESI